MTYYWNEFPSNMVADSREKAMRLRMARPLQVVFCLSCVHWVQMELPL